MGMQDDIFDIRDALKNKPEKEAFARVEKSLGYYEQAYEQARKTLHDIKVGARAFKSLMEGK